MFEIFDLTTFLFGFIDPVMAVWIVVVMVLGYWLKRTNSLPSWLPPLPVLLLSAFLAVGFFFGALTNTTEGWKGVLYVLAYGIGNGIIFTGLSFIIYDIAHAIFKRKAQAKESDATTNTSVDAKAAKTAEVTKGDEEEPVSAADKAKFKRKALIYGLAGFAGFLLAFLVSLLGFSETMRYAIYFGLFGAGAAATIARTVYHLVVEGSWRAMWAVSLDFAISCAGWLYAVLTTSWTGVSIGLAVMCFGLIMAWGNRFVRLIADATVGEQGIANQIIRK